MTSIDQPPPDGLERLVWASLAPIDDALAWRVLVNLVEYANTTGLALPHDEELAARCRTDLAGLARALRILERDGYVQCAVAESNGRSMYRVMTPGAGPMVADWVPMAVKFSDIPQAWTWPLPTDPTQINNANAPTLFEAL